MQTLIYDGSVVPSIFTYTQTGLTTGATYYFYLSAINFNGEGPQSSPAVYTACTQPSRLAAPKVISTTATTVNLVWNYPLDDGGCPLTSYILFLDDGNGGAFASFAPSDIMYQPYLLAYQIVLPSSQTGLNYRLYLRALNMIGYADSTIVNVILADVPQKPAPPTHDQTQTSASQIYVKYTTTGDNGSPIISYELQMDDGNGGDYTSLIGFSSQYLKLWYVVTSNITKGTTYRFRVRALNSVGWGSFSDPAYILAAQVPKKPAPPVFVSSSSSSITISF